MNNNMMLMLLPFLMGKTGGNNADTMQMMMRLFGDNGGASGKNAMLSFLMAMMMKKTPDNCQTPPAENSVPDLSGLFGKDVWNVMQLFMSMNK